MMKKKKTWVIVSVVVVLIIIGIFSSSDEESVQSPDTKDASGQTTVSAKDASEPKSQPTAVPPTAVPPTAVPTPAPIIFSDEQASTFLLKPNDFPKNWTAKKNGMILDAELIEVVRNAAIGKMIKITLKTHETEAAAQAAFSTKKTEAQATIDDRGISGDKLEDIKNYQMFVWDANAVAVSGYEFWTVTGVYGNITVNVVHNGSAGQPKKNFAVDIAKKQMDKIMGD